MKKERKKYLAVFLLMIAVLFAPVTSLAEEVNLKDILEQVNKSNPALKAAREALLANYEVLPTAMARFLPTLQTFADVSQVDRHRRIGKNRGGGLAAVCAVNGQPVRAPNFEVPTDPCQGVGTLATAPVPGQTVRNEDKTANARSHGANMQVNLFRSGGDYHTYQAADYSAEQGVANYRETEQTVFLEAIQAYLSVRLTYDTIRHRQANYDALAEQLRITRQQYDVQDKTRADLEQVSARVAVAMADVADAESSFNQAVATYVRVVGEQPPGTLAQVPPAMGLGVDVDDLIVSAQKSNFLIRSARAAWLSALASQKSVLSQAGPVVDLYARYNENRAELDDYRVVNNDIGLRFSMPLYQGGAISSEVRRNEKMAAQRRNEMYSTMRRVREQIIGTWNRYKAGGARVSALKEAVRAAKVAMEAVRVEVEFEQRLVVDELDAARDLVNNQVSLERAQHDRILASYQLSYQTGGLTAPALGLQDMMPRRPDKFELRNFVPTPFNFIEYSDIYWGGEEEK